MPTNPRYRVVAFDYGGTLTYPRGQEPAGRDPLFTGEVLADFLRLSSRGPLEPERLQELADQVDRSLAPPGQTSCQAISERLVRWAEGILRGLGQRRPMRAECEELACHYRRRCLSRAGEVPQKHREVLAELQRRRYRLAVLSNNDGYVEDRLIKEGIRDFFEAVFDSARVGLAKPDARLFALVEKHFHVGPGDCLYVGDDPAVDVVGAQGAGWAAAWLRTGREALAGSPRPDITLTSLEELLAHL